MPQCGTAQFQTNAKECLIGRNTSAVRPYVCPFVLINFSPIIINSLSPNSNAPDIDKVINNTNNTNRLMALHVLVSLLAARAQSFDLHYTY